MSTHDLLEEKHQQLSRIESAKVKVIPDLHSSSGESSRTSCSIDDEETEHCKKLTEAEEELAMNNLEQLCCDYNVYPFKSKETAEAAEHSSVENTGADSSDTTGQEGSVAEMSIECAEHVSSVLANAEV